jgi:hypothetical protein
MKLIHILLIPLIMSSGCHSGQKASGPAPEAVLFILNGQELKLDAEAREQLLAAVLDHFRASDDFYELLVTDGLMGTIRQEQQWLELIFPQKKTLVTEKFGEIDVSNIFIPLSGRYAGGDQLTFFSGTDGYSNTPLVKMSGLEELQTSLGKQE